MKRVPCAFSVSKDFLKVIDARADALGLSRSAYIVQVLRKELLSGSATLSIVSERPTRYTGARKKATRKKRTKKS